jgi:hypothetical protein
MTWRIATVACAVLALAFALRGLSSSERARLLRGGVPAGLAWLPHGSRIGDGMSLRTYAVFAPAYARVDLWARWYWRRWRKTGTTGVLELKYFLTGNDFGTTRVRVELVDGAEGVKIVAPAFDEESSRALDAASKSFPVTRRRGR